MEEPMEASTVFQHSSCLPDYHHLVDLITALEESVKQNQRSRTTQGASKKPKRRRHRVCVSQVSEAQCGEVPNDKAVQFCKRTAAAGRSSSVDEDKRCRWTVEAAAEMSISDNEVSTNTPLWKGNPRIQMNSCNVTESDGLLTDIAGPNLSKRRRRLIKRILVEKCLQTNNNKNQEEMDVDFDTPSVSTSASALRLPMRFCSESSMELDGGCNRPVGTESDGDVSTGDNGNDGDDEQSDWYHDGSSLMTENEYLGVPDFKAYALAKINVAVVKSRLIRAASSETDAEAPAVTKRTRRDIGPVRN
ncbi:hypothetical protein D918_03595 [Trichuris suis]|nr:hypothetical protein D918_03595 [Trichuris suis]